MAIKLPSPRIAVTPINKPSLALPEAFAIKDLARSGLTPADIPIYCEAAPVVDSKFVHGVVSNQVPYYVIPYYDRHGFLIFTDKGNHAKMFRMRRDDLELRYISPSREDVGDLCTLPYFHPGRIEKAWVEDVYVIVEGEKKYAKVLKECGLYGCAIAGKDMWRNQELLEDIAERKQAKAIHIIPDGDWRRQDILSSYSLLVDYLRNYFGIPILIRDLSGFRTRDDKRMGADDYLVADLKWEDVPLIDPGNELLLTPEQLIDRYALEFNENSEHRRTIRDNSSNVDKLLNAHALFNAEALWFNMDLGMPVFRDDTKNIIHNLTVNLQRFCHIPKVSFEVVKRAYISVCDKRQRSPRLEYIKEIQWDGTNRIEQSLEHIITKREHEEYRAEALRRLFLQAIARITNPGCKADTIIIFIGPQGKHKSTFWEVISYGSSAALGKTKNERDAIGIIHSKWFIVLEELDWMRHQEHSTMKRFVTQVDDTIRPLYRDGSVTMPRRFVFVGNNNSTEVLSDRENRRFMPIWVDDIDLDWFKQNLDQLWAEAYHRYVKGETWWSDDESVWEHAKLLFVETIPREAEFEFAISTLTKMGGLYEMYGRTAKGFELKDLMVHVSNVSVQLAANILDRMGYTSDRVKCGRAEGKKHTQRKLWWKEVRDE